MTKLNHELIVLQGAFHRDAGAIVVAVQRLAFTVVRDKMRRAKNEIIFGDVDFEVCHAKSITHPLRMTSAFYIPLNSR